MEPENIRKQAEEARQKAEHAYRTSEYPRLGRAAYTGLSEALENLAATVEAPKAVPRAENEYEIKRAARVDRLKERAAKLRVLAAEADCRSHDIGRAIPFGQPILVGHHSEGRHRNDIKRMRNASEKAARLLALAERAERSAVSAADPYAISSDDPEAIQKLRAEVAEMEAERDRMKAATKLAAKDDAEGLKALGYSEEVVYRLLNPRYGYERKGFSGWETTNLSANIRRVKGRIAVLEREANKSDADRLQLSGDGFRVFEDPADNRICFEFEGKPAENVRKELKSRGFKWSPSRGLWIRLLNDNARWAARHAVEAIGKI